ncbi:hypothetical protein PP713_09435 [Mycobacterium sp. CSUR Q5927]|nr:hypothetical protein [Mycobacterium sp. CSUR Q5927]
MADFSRLSAAWIEWAPRGGLTEATASEACADCEILFASSDYSVHLYEDGSWWTVDTVDDRRQRSRGVAKFATFDLAEKYLIWDWICTACPRLASGELGADLYKKGYAPDIEVAQANDGHIEICLRGDCAVLVSGTSTIFSHIMLMSVDQIEQAGKRALDPSP